jgi:hypothetical protein
VDQHEPEPGTAAVAPSARATIDAYFAGINEERYRDVAALFASDGQLVAPGTAPRVGADAIAAYFEAALAPYPVHHDGATRQIFAGSTVTVEITFTGELASGAPLAFDAVDVFDLDEQARIVRLTSWYDSHAVRAALREARGGAARKEPMPDRLLVAQVSALPGQDEEFNTWYAEHMREVRAVPGIASGTRYRIGAEQAPGAAEPQHEYLALYAIDGDAGELVEELARRRADGEWQPRRGIDNETIKMWAFERVGDDGRRRW